MSLCAAESPRAVQESEWETSLSDSLEKEVQEARSMVSSLQVGTSLSETFFMMYYNYFEIFFYFIHKSISYAPRFNGEKKELQ